MELSGLLSAEEENTDNGTLSTRRPVHTVRFALPATAFFYMRFCEIVYTVRWVWMRFAMYLYWNHTLQSHRMGIEPIHV